MGHNFFSLRELWLPESSEHILLLLESLDASMPPSWREGRDDRSPVLDDDAPADTANRTQHASDSTRSIVRLGDKSPAEADAARAIHVQYLDEM